MSPAAAMERSYGRIKEMLRNGVFTSGTRLDANRLSLEIGVSMTPVRDVLHRLVGEQLVEATTGDGFRVPRFSETQLRDLYEWNSALMIMASRTAGIQPITAACDTPGTVTARFSAMILSIAGLVPNKEIGAALKRSDDRLHPFRIAEEQVFNNLVEEFYELNCQQFRRPGTIRRYHIRRMRAVSELIVERDRQ